MVHIFWGAVKQTKLTRQITHESLYLSVVLRISALWLATLWNISRQFGPGVAPSAAQTRHAACVHIQDTRNLKNNNQFNYPQNIYCGILSCGHKRRRERDAPRCLAALSVRPFSTRFAVVIAWFSARAVFTPPTYPAYAHVRRLRRCIHLYVSHGSALSLSHPLFLCAASSSALFGLVCREAFWACAHSVF